MYGNTPLPKSKKMDSIFKDNPGLDVAYKTADGKYFYTENGAQNYALTLKDQAVKKVVRTEKEEVEKEDVTETENPKTVVTAESPEPSGNSENSNVSETLEPLEEEDSEETKPNLELKSNKQNKR